MQRSYSAVLYLVFFNGLIVVALAVLEEIINFAHRHFLPGDHGQKLPDPPDKGREAERVRWQVVVHIGHLSGRHQHGIGKHVGLFLEGKHELRQIMVFLMRGDDYNFEPIEYLDPLVIAEDLRLEPAEHPVGRIVLYPNEGVRDVHQHQRLDLLHDVIEEPIDGPAREVGKREHGALLVREYAEVVLSLNGDILDDFPDLEGVLINILLVIEGEWACALQHEDLRHAALVVAHL